MTETTSGTGVKNFSRPRKRILFQIDDDTFEAAVAVPAETFVELTLSYSDLGDSDTWADNYKALDSALELVLLPESYERLAPRFKDKQRPVELDQMADVIMWLLEEYGLRPTQPSSDSSDGQPSPASGTSSTESTPAATSTSEVSLPIAS